MYKLSVMVIRYELRQELKQPVRNVLSSSLVVALGIIITYHFILLWIHGQVIIVEPNLYVRLGETFLGVAITVFGLERLARI